MPNFLLGRSEEYVFLEPFESPPSGYVEECYDELSALPFLRGLADDPINMAVLTDLWEETRGTCSSEPTEMILRELAYRIDEGQIRVFRCEETQSVLPPPPPPKKKEEKKADEEPQIKCRILWIKAKCGHGDNRSGEFDIKSPKTLEVVPDSTYGSDRIDLSCAIEDSCGNHPGWRITGESEKKGETASFGATGPTSSKLWLPSINPKSYSVVCEGCGGGGLTGSVSAYPSNQFSGTVDFKNLLKIVRKITGVLEEVLEVVTDRFEWKYLEGKVQAEFGWKEHTDYRAFFAYKIAVAFDPLFGGEFKFTIGPSKITKMVRKIPGIGKYIERAVNWLVEAGLYLKVGGGIGCDLKYERTSPDEKKFTRNLGTGASGKIDLALGATGGVVDDLLRINLEVSGAVSAKADTLMDDKGFGLKFAVDFDGLKGNVKLVFLWSLLDMNETVTFIGPRNIWKPKDPVYIWSE